MQKFSLMEILKILNLFKYRNRDTVMIDLTVDADMNMLVLLDLNVKISKFETKLRSKDQGNDKGEHPLSSPSIKQHTLSTSHVTSAMK